MAYLSILFRRTTCRGVKKLFISKLCEDTCFLGHLKLLQGSPEPGDGAGLVLGRLQEEPLQDPPPGDPGIQIPKSSLSPGSLARPPLKPSPHCCRHSLQLWLKKRGSGRAAALGLGLPAGPNPETEVCLE